MVKNQAHEMTQSMYIKVFLAILVVTVFTFLQPFILGETLVQKVSIQMFLAIVKSTLIIVYYMHLKYESRILKLFVYFTILVLCLLFIIISSDVIFRDEIFDLFQ